MGARLLYLLCLGWSFPLDASEGVGLWCTTEYTFPPGLSNHDRAVVHAECKKYGFTSKSFGCVPSSGFDREPGLRELSILLAAACVYAGVHSAWV